MAGMMSEMCSLNTEHLHSLRDRIVTPSADQIHLSQVFIRVSTKTKNVELEFDNLSRVVLGHI